MPHHPAGLKRMTTAGWPTSSRSSAAPVPPAEVEASPERLEQNHRTDAEGPLIFTQRLPRAWVCRLCADAGSSLHGALLSIASRLDAHILHRSNDGCIERGR